ncbi:hypothetical protein TNIN_467471 [Trichonephila inaurata madagascariensis]|uniref:Uncharacterized protein n=1 Tax=Trichonephila inaurata madagascariensis TaxID=2747483 RepID=A0A8X6WY83_9ARAC|nr:hypothetical protein TNIN_467471 [Trichonephila inaurata madagascariensis]
MPCPGTVHIKGTAVKKITQMVQTTITTCMTRSKNLSQVLQYTNERFNHGEILLLHENQLKLIHNLVSVSQANWSDTLQYAFKRAEMEIGTK